MLAQIGRRLASAAVALAVSAVAVFILLRLTPGDPVLMYAGVDASPEVRAAVRQTMGLDQPLPLQFAHWLARTLRGDLGRSFTSGLPVLDLVRARVPATIELATGAAVVAAAVAIPVGVIAAVRRDGLLDLLIRAASALALSVPNFWGGILLILFFSLLLGWLPPGGYAALTDPGANLRFLVLPMVTLSLQNIAVLGRFVRASVLDALYRDYIRTARAKGLPSSAVLYRHALRNALIPVLTVLGLQVGRMLGGAVIVEAVFAWPGMGQLILQAVGNRDYPVVQGALLVFVLMFVLVSMLIDIAIVLADPTVRAHAL
jgi:peptide/nickel transport system permease protein